MQSDEHMINSISLFFFCKLKAACFCRFARFQRKLKSKGGKEKTANKWMFLNGSGWKSQGNIWGPLCCAGGADIMTAYWWSRTWNLPTTMIPLTVIVRCFCRAPKKMFEKGHGSPEIGWERSMSLNHCSANSMCFPEWHLGLITNWSPLLYCIVSLSSVGFPFPSIGSCSIFFSPGHEFA